MFVYIYWGPMGLLCSTWRFRIAMINDRNIRRRSQTTSQSHGQRDKLRWYKKLASAYWVCAYASESLVFPQSDDEFACLTNGSLVALRAHAFNVPAPCEPNMRPSTCVPRIDCPPAAGLDEMEHPSKAMLNPQGNADFHTFVSLLEGNACFGQHCNCCSQPSMRHGTCAWHGIYKFMIGDQSIKWATQWLMRPSVCSTDGFLWVSMWCRIWTIMGWE